MTPILSGVAPSPGQELLAVEAAAEPTRIASPAGRLRTLMSLFLDTPTASATAATFFAHRTDTAGRHDPAPRMPAGSAPLLATALLDHSPKPS
ncbi:MULTISPECIES: hypothetical protein [unclassified Streptomyces]|uniref:hypothetical protein n=1 Tax=unclassified Streptomyces TaxID=2593676 RepID=UPI00224E89C1|nr:MULTISPECIES: hypothetical protein [unclassified Streptomyces]MCX5053776.1 hypothetical protein [Streptomyces sp. NBC_00474]